MIANEPALGVRPAEQYLFFIILSPVGAYYPEGFSPTKIFVSDEFVRAAKGGAGEAKTSGNYGPTLLASRRAAEQGYTQVLWIDAKERKYVEEVGTSNIFFLINNELVTPPLDGTILPGVTRDSVLRIAQHWKINVLERPITIQEVIDAAGSGALKEMFATGTAAVISPVGEICYQEKVLKIADGQTGEFAPVNVDHVDYGDVLDSADYDPTVIDTSIALLGPANTSWTGIPVRSYVSNAWENDKVWTKDLSQKWFQVRFRPANAR